MKKIVSQLAINNGTPLFSRILPVGQINIPDYEKFKFLVNDIFNRKYYTNHGKLTQDFEDKISKKFNVKNSIAITNGTVALSIACKALELPVRCKVIVPSFTFIGTVQALTWAGLEPVFCDISSTTHTIMEKNVLPLLQKDKSIKAILGVHLWGNPCEIDKLDQIEKEYNVKVFYDAAHAIGCKYNGEHIGKFGHCAMFSLHATKILSASEGGLLCTDDDELAEKIRNIRSSYGRKKNVPVSIAINGRFSELQAAMALLSLEGFDENVLKNKARYFAYKELVKDIPGIEIINYDEKTQGNYQYIVFTLNENEFGMSRDMLVKILEAENIHARRYFLPSSHNSYPYNQMDLLKDDLVVTEQLNEKIFQLPSGQLIEKEDIEKICELLSFIQKNAQEICKVLDNSIIL